MLSSTIPEPLVEKLDPWFDDGNIVLSCEGVARLRVHAGVLARHSEMFRNMFADAKAPTSPYTPMVEGCPVIEVSDETQDIQNLMSALYGPINFKMNNVDDFLHLSSILRLATKYCIDWLRIKAANYLSRFWPHTLQEWVDLVRSPGSCWEIHPALVINLARKVDLPIFLPIALYRLGRMSIQDAHETDLTSVAGPIPKAAYCLSLEDVLNHLRYREQAFLSARSFVEDFLEEFEPDPTCSSATRDVDLCSDIVKQISSHVRGEHLDEHPPLTFMSLATDDRFSLCSSCRGRLDSAVKERREALWDELPSWFGLPNWQVLTADFTKEDNF